MRRSVAIGFVTLIAAAAVGYSVNEVRLRLRYYPPATRPFPFIHRPLVTKSVILSRDVPGLKAQTTTWSTNSRGLRGDEIDLQGSADTFKILTLGGSVTECLLVDDRDAWPRVVQDVMADRTGAKVWVGNAGVSGQNTLDYIAHMKTLVPAVRPDLVIVMPGGNDLQAAVEERLLPLDLDEPMTLQQFQARLYHPEYVTLFEELEPSYTLTTRRLPIEVPETKIAGFYLEKKARRYVAPKLAEIPDWADHLEVYGQNLEALIKAAAALPATRLVLLTHPYLWKEPMTDEEQRALWGGYSCLSCPDPVYYSHQALARGLADLNRVTLDACKTHGVTCFDLEAKLEKSLDHFYDDAHLKKAGSRAVGRLVGEFLAAGGASK